jgi:cyclase
MGRAYEAGLQEVGDGLYAYLQPDGGWGWSNAGPISDGESRKPGA